RRGMGVRSIGIKTLLMGVLFLYLIGNMVGHNYHDLYRDRSATIWGARAHFTYLVLFIAMAVYRKVEAWQQGNTTKPSSWGNPNRLAEVLQMNPWFESTGSSYRSVVMEPLAVVVLGLFFAVVLQNWFGWYLVLVGCLFFHWLLQIHLKEREAVLDGREMTLALRASSSNEPEESRATPQVSAPQMRDGKGLEGGEKV